MDRAVRAVSLGVFSIIVIAITLILGFRVLLNTTFNTTNTTASPSLTFSSSTLTNSAYTLPTSITTIAASSATTFSCIINGEPGPFFLGILSDSAQTPIVGALVKATNQPASCNGSPATTQTTVIFTTNGEWYPLDGSNNAGYSLTVNYSGQNYTFTANLRPISVTCATLYIPSGRTNITITEAKTTCPTSA